MKEVSRIKLSEIFKRIARPRYVLGTTYTLSLAFFESAVFPFIGRSEMRSCLIVCDSIGYHRALSEGAALQGAAQDYLVVPAPFSGSFHPKVWIVVGEREVVLLVGSGNLTQAGFMTNAEVFDALHFNEDSPASPQLMESVRAFVRGLEKMWAPADAQHLLCVDILARIDEVLGRIPVTADTKEAIHFLHSFNGPLIKQLPVVSDAEQLYVAAPFFGQSLGGLNLLLKRYPTAKLSVFPGVHGDATDIPLKQVSTSYQKAKVSRLSVPNKRKDTFAHLKLYGVGKKDGAAWIFCTSANCTEAAWGGTNAEAGILRFVSRASLSKYFVADDGVLPQGAIAYEQNGTAGGGLQFWASDSGTRMDLIVAEGCAAQLPLRDVVVTVRCGSSLAVCRKATVFQQGRIAHIDWTSFPDWYRRKKMAVCIEIQGVSAAGVAVHGSCFVENRLLLTADPVHRSAWRGALSLLDEEGAPELADIAAIFSLARDLFDGNLIRVPKAPAAGVNEAGSEDGQEPHAIAVWPPQPDIRDLQKRIGSTATGQLQWFQRILQTLLHNETCDGDAEEAGVAEDLDDGDDVSETGTRRIDEKRPDETAAERLWAKARKDYEYLHDRLFKLAPTGENAQNVWPAAVFAFLSTMAVLRAVRRMAPGIDLKTGSDVLTDDFVRVMLNERRQHDDFCCPREFRYRSEKFPALADDLRNNFKIHVHYDLAVIMLALLTDQKMRFPFGRGVTFGHRQVRQICDQGFTVDVGTVESCRRVWRRYLVDTGRKATDAEFLAAFRQIVPPEFTSV